MRVTKWLLIGAMLLAMALFAKDVICAPDLSIAGDIDAQTATLNLEGNRIVKATVHNWVHQEVGSATAENYGAAIVVNDNLNYGIEQDGMLTASPPAISIGQQGSDSNGSGYTVINIPPTASAGQMHHDQGHASAATG